MNIFVLLAAIIGLTNASTSELFHGFTRTTIQGPSGTIVQETPGTHILNSFSSSNVYAPAFSAAVAVPEPVVAEHAPIVQATSYGAPLLHSVVPQSVVPAHGFTRTTIQGPSGTIVQETPGAHILNSFSSGRVYAPAFSAAVAVPEPVVAEHAPVVPAISYEAPLLHHVVPEPIVPAPVVPFPGPVVRESYLPQSLAYPYAFPGSVPFPYSSIPFSPYFESRAFPVPPFVEPALHFPAPAQFVESRFFPEPPVYTERLVHPAPVVPAPVPVAPVEVYPVKTFPEITYGKYPPAVPATQYGL